MRIISALTNVLLASIIVIGCSSGNEIDEAITELETITGKMVTMVKTMDRATAESSPDFKTLGQQYNEVEARLGARQAEWTPEQKERIKKALLGLQAEMDLAWK